RCGGWRGGGCGWVRSWPPRLGRRYNIYTKTIRRDGAVDFEFDPEKSALNKEKHGIDFVEAQALWWDERRLEVPARTLDEPRFLIIGTIAERCWSAVVTYRATVIRITSVRRSRTEEIDLYEEEEG